MARAFVVGNGPSLVKMDLDLLIGEVSFACNRINRIYSRTHWRPNYYVRAEGVELLNKPSAELWADDVLTHLRDPNITTWINHYYKIQLGHAGLSEDWQSYRRDGTTFWMDACAHYLAHYDETNCPVMWHFPRLCSFGSSVNVAVQLAVQLGYGPIYLIGCDLGYRDGQPSHFDPDYEQGYEDMLRPARYANNDTYMAHMIAKRCSPVPIFNATVGGQLEAYERIDFETLFSRVGPLAARHPA